MMSRITVLLSVAVIFAGCQTQKQSYYIAKPISKAGRMALLVKGKNEVKNAAFIEFLNAGYKLKALNAADFYTIKDVFDIKSFKENSKTAAMRKKDTKYTATLLDRVFDNVYKLHIYNFEISKADYIKDLAKKWQIDYIVLLSMKDWQKGYSWVRVINVSSLELEYVHNYKAGSRDTFQTIIKQMVQVMSTGK